MDDLFSDNGKGIISNYIDNDKPLYSFFKTKKWIHGVKWLAIQAQMMVPSGWTVLNILQRAEDLLEN